MSTDEELINYYVNLLILQYSGLTNADSTVASVMSKIIIYELSEQVRKGFDIETAVGKQLDYLGKILGTDRVVTGSSFTREYFGYSEYNEVSPFTFNSYLKYGEDSSGIQIRSYKESGSSLFSLNDEEFRTVLKLKVNQNNSNYSVYDIDTFLSSFFENQAIFNDKFNMFVTYIFDSSVERLVTIALSEKLIPKPAGVGLGISFTKDIQNIFSYSKYGGSKPNFAVGYSEYGETIIGGMGRYANT